MSQENVEIVRRAYEAFNRGDRDAGVADVAPDCEYVASGDGKAVRGEGFTSREEALEAAGLRE